jgi:hypothetical protein
MAPTADLILEEIAVRLLRGQNEVGTVPHGHL